MILCGWCGKATVPAGRCQQCGHEDPARPWIQRAQEPPAVRVDAAGRPGLDAATIRRRIRDAREALGPNPTKDALAERLGISTRTLGRWQKLAG